MTDFAEIVADYDDAPPIYYATIVATLERLAGLESIGLEAAAVQAWQQLTPTERRDTLPHILGAYAARVIDEEREKTHEELADNPAVTTCLLPHDEATAWDAATDDSGLPPEADETVINRQALTNLLMELDLLRRRTATTEATP